MKNTKININNKNYDLNDDPDTFLLEILRNKLKLKGAKFGCGLEQCGACLVIADNESLYSCTSCLYNNCISLSQNPDIQTLKSWILAEMWD